MTYYLRCLEVGFGKKWNVTMTELTVSLLLRAGLVNSMSRTICMDEVSKHNKSGDLWTVLYGKVYDLSKFAPEHPGGEAIVVKYAGRDGTKAFDPLHSRSILDTLLAPEVCLGDVDPATVVEEPEEEADVHAITEVAKSGGKPPIHHMVNVFDFEPVAKANMTKPGWDYYSSGADDEITMRENHLAFQRIWLRPRILVNVKHIDMSTTMLGCKASIPLYITATALGKLAHPEGEVVLTRAAHTANIPQMIPTLASCSMDEIHAAAKDGQPQWFQLYVNADKKITQRLVEKAERYGCKGLFITVDAPMLGRREKDMRNKFAATAPTVQREGGKDVKRDGGTARAISAFINPALCWDDLPWFKTITKMPILLKGVQCAEDAVLAFRAGIDGIVISNHGGRQLDCARSAIEILKEVMDALRDNGAPPSFEVYIDGGIRRGTDIFKALALGAKGCGIGRPCLYGMAAYGQEGVEKVIQIFKDELDMCMSLMGTPSIKDISPHMVLTRNISDHFVPQGHDNLLSSTYEPLNTTVAMNGISKM